MAPAVAIARPVGPRMRSAPHPVKRGPTARLRNGFELLVAGRLLRSKRSAHLSVISVMSMAGIALGVAALIVVLAVNTGFQVAFQERILAAYPHLVVMRRGVDLSDYADVAARLSALPEVRQVSPATYDDMMLSSAQGRAGAIVRGVPAATMVSLPPGVVAEGAIDLFGELPRWKVDTDDGAVRLRVERGVAAARHVLIVRDDALGGAEVRAVAVIPPPPGLAGLRVFDADGCGSDAAKLPGSKLPGSLTLRHASGGEVVRTTGRRPCRLDASWETLAGRLALGWDHGGEAVEHVIDLDADRATLAVVSGRSLVTAPAVDDELSAAAAAVAIVHLGNRPLHLTLPDGRSLQVAPGERTVWYGFAADLPPIALGEGLARRLEVHVGDEVRAVSPLRTMDRDRDTSAPGTSGRFRVATILSTGFYDHDQRLALVDFTAVQRFLGRGDVARWVDVRVEDPIVVRSRTDAFLAALDPVDMEDILLDINNMRDRLRRIQAEPVPGLELRSADSAVAIVDNWVTGLRAMRQGQRRATSIYRVIDWEEMNRNIFDAARMQKVAMSLFPFIIVLVAALNVIGTQAVVVHERARDISILRAMGATRRSVGFIFLSQGLAVGLVGTAVGLLVGGLTCALLMAIGYPLDPHVYLISELPVQVDGSTFALAGGSAVALTFAASWLSARRAALRSPVDGLRRLD